MTSTEIRISAAIQNSGMSYYEIAKELDVSQSLVRRWALTGKISLNNVTVLCELLNIKVADLFSEKIQDLRPIQQKAISLITRLAEDKDDQIQIIIKILE